MGSGREGDPRGKAQAPRLGWKRAATLVGLPHVRMY